MTVAIRFPGLEFDKDGSFMQWVFPRGCMGKGHKPDEFELASYGRMLPRMLASIGS